MNRGGSLKRPELGDCIRGDVLLIKQVDRLLRLSYAGWEALKCEVGARGDVRIVELDITAIPVLTTSANPRLTRG